MVRGSSLEVALFDLISSRESDLNDWNFLEKTKELPFLVLGRLRNTVGKRMMLKMILKTMMMKSNYELIIECSTGKNYENQLI